MLLTFSACDDGKVNFFTVDQDKQFGEEVFAELSADPATYPILPREGNEALYERVEALRDEILASGELRHAETFDWDIYLIDDDVLNAFAIPGGKTFYYTGLIRFLDNEASLAGVMAHEMAHVDRRHSTAMMTRHHGYQTLLAVLLGNNETVVGELAGSLALGLGNMAYSRDNEYEADAYAVNYLYNTKYDARGVAYFFEKLESGEQSRIATYLSTHPSPDDRVEKIHQEHQKLGGKEGGKYETEYKELKTLLP